MTCKLPSGCENEVFEKLDYCALHCEKDNYELDFESDLLKEFHKLLHLYIIDKLLSTPTQDLKNQSYRNKLIDYRNTYHQNHQNIISALHRQPIFIEFFSSRTVLFEFIHFPQQRYLGYLEVLKLFKGVWFANCVFHIRDLNTESTKVYFKGCVFNNDFRVNKLVLHKIERSYVFYKCTFNSKVYIDLKDEEKEDRVIKYSLFEECDFKGVVLLSNVEFKKEVFKFAPIPNIDTEVSEPTCISSILINDVVFHDKCKFNYIDVVNLVIRDTKFLSKLEVKESVISYFELNNSNVSEVFDSFNSRFIRFIFYKSIFTDFSGFEKVNFGLRGSVNDLYVARFVYTTFMSFSNFRSTKFLSGLDFENSNLKEQPNFLKAEIDSKNTNRETFRIVKHSFDNVGNKIEANKFYSKEMDAYRREMKGEFKLSERFVFCMNNFISEFGTSYLKPILLLIILFEIYIILLSYYCGSYSLYGAIVQLDILNSLAKDFLLFSRFLKAGFEFVSLIFYIFSGILIWQIAVAIKRHTQR